MRSAPTGTGAPVRTRTDPAYRSSAPPTTRGVCVRDGSQAKALSDQSSTSRAGTLSRSWV